MQEISETNFNSREWWPSSPTSIKCERPRRSTPDPRGQKMASQARKHTNSNLPVKSFDEITMFWQSDIIQSSSQPMRRTSKRPRQKPPKLSWRSSGENWKFFLGKNTSWAFKKPKKMWDRPLSTEKYDYLHTNCTTAIWSCWRSSTSTKMIPPSWMDQKWYGNPKKGHEGHLFDMGMERSGTRLFKIHGSLRSKRNF